MPTQPDHHRLRVGSPADLLAIVPHLLGFVPDRSLVVVGARGPTHRIEVTFRFDLPDPPDRQAAAAIAAHAVKVLASQQFTLVVVIGYGPGPLVTPVADGIRQAITGTSLELRDVLRVEAGRYWSYLCKNPDCCQPEGVPFDTTTHPAAAIMAAASAEPSWPAARNWPPASPRSPGRLPKQCGRKPTAPNGSRLGSSPAPPPAGSTGRPVVDRGLGAVQAAIGIYRDGGSLTETSQFAWLALALSTLQVRDDAWARMDPAHCEAHLRLWADLTRHAQPGYVAAPASLLAFTAWQAGNGALANVALDRAQADTPDYSMAQLLRDTIDAGAPPSLARLPMTPEEVAASYNEPVAEDGTNQAEPGSTDAGEDRAS